VRHTESNDQLLRRPKEDDVGGPRLRGRARVTRDKSECCEEVEQR